MNIGSKSIKTGFDLAKALYLDKMAEMMDAAAISEDGLTVALSVKFTPSKKALDRVDIDASISFIKERVKDSAGASIYEGQELLFPEDVAEPDSRASEDLTADDNGPWSREIKFTAVDTMWQPGFPVRTLCKQCLEQTTHEEAWVTCPGIGQCPSCGAESVRQYMVPA